MYPRTASAYAGRLKIPPATDWRTTDADEINKRRLRAREEALKISEIDSFHPIFANFQVSSPSGMTYAVEIRDVRQRHFACECTDFRTNGLGTCKHLEAVMLHLQTRRQQQFREAHRNGSTRIDIVPDRVAGTLRIERGTGSLPPALGQLFGKDGLLQREAPETALELLQQTELPTLRISQEVEPWLEARRQAEERIILRRQYEAKVHSGEWPAHETLVPLYPYQREGMLHLAFTERSLLADEMGLGKTIQAIAACALLHRLGKVSRALVVTPASLKTEWEEQIKRFTVLPYQLVFGERAQRMRAYDSPPFFTIVNYEQMLRDAMEVNRRLKPDLVILDEAQRIKNWNTQTAQTIKRIRSRYAFVLTGTPIENRIDELYSLMDFLNPSVFGPLFRFNREFYELDDHGKPIEYRNLDQLHARIKPYLLRRRKADVETELPDRTDRTHFVSLSNEQRLTYEEHEAKVARLANIARRRPLMKEEQERLMRELAMMRMVCDTNYILDDNDRVCPKLAELEKILDECRENTEVQVIVFSEWQRMLELVRELCGLMKLGCAWHTGSVPQRKRRDEINRFKSDPMCRVFLSTDSGSTGLNLQNASVVINCDLPWNPAKLEQRIARAWRKHQTRPVTVINLVSENTIEHKMLGTLASKQALADGVLDLRGDLKSLKLTSSRQAFLEKIQRLISTPAPAKPKAPPSDRAKAFSERAFEKINGALLRCEERYPVEGSHSVLVAVVERDAAQWRDKLLPLFDELCGDGKGDATAPTRLEVIDRATDEAISKMVEAGLFTRTIRAARQLHPAERKEDTAIQLSDAERQRLEAHRAQAARKLKAARLLGNEELTEEARQALLEAILHQGRAFAVEARLSEPAEVKDAVLPLLSLCWGDSLPLVRAFILDPSAPWKPVAEILAPR